MNTCLWTLNLIMSITTTVHAFSATFPKSTMIPSSLTTRTSKTNNPSKPPALLKLQMARIPEIDEWRLLKNDRVYGSVRFHPVIDDGDFIATSPIKNANNLVENSVVSTISGSKYKLRFASTAMKKKLDARDKMAEKEKKKPLININKTKKDDTINISSSPPKLSLSGKSVGDGQYLLAGKPIRSTSGKSQIWNAYKADKEGNPIVPSSKSGCIMVKISTNIEALSRENNNYQRVTKGLLKGKFVNKLDFYDVKDNDPDDETRNDNEFSKQSVLVMEGGSKDLKNLLAERQYRGLKGKSMRDAGAAAGQCVQAMHAANLVWTDLKSENFVVVGEDAELNIKGIDLESAMPCRSNPVDYSPEACPPEFATALSKGQAPDFILDPSYDMWSLGMLLYELSVGRPYFDNKTPISITKTLKNPQFEPDVSSVEDPKLQDLIRSCLDKDPKKRPNITQFLLHPFFTTTGIGPLSF